MGNGEWGRGGRGGRIIVYSPISPLPTPHSPLLRNRVSAQSKVPVVNH
ncbi:MAG: hypothetical protein DSM106950_35920 [Stigonema ocellatum SAG 48.90 = DSM 106950]|nr:hypothetical protein [Stigonema ocellatum SAG 48.90 = DSM 106950]